MPQPQTKLSDEASWLGEDISGDIGDVTYYTTRRGRIVAYPASPAMKPPTPKQLKQRLRFRKALSNWYALSQSTRDQWNTLCKKLSLPYTGQNLWVSLSLIPRDSQLQSASTAAKLTLSPPPYLRP